MNIISNIKHLFNGADIDSLYEKIACLENNLNKILDDNAKKTAQITRLENKAKALNEDLISEQKKALVLENKQKEINSLTFKLSESEKLIASLESQKTSFIEKQESLTKKNSSLQLKNDRMENQISSLQEEKDCLLAELSKQKEQSSELVKKSDDFKQVLKKSESENHKNVAEIGRLNEELERMNEELAREHENTELTNKKISEINDLYIKLQKDSSKEKDALCKKIEEADEHIKVLENQIRSLQDTNKNLLDSDSPHVSEMQEEQTDHLEKSDSVASATLKESENTFSQQANEEESQKEEECSPIDELDKSLSQLNKTQSISDSKDKEFETIEKKGYQGNRTITSDESSTNITDNALRNDGGEFEKNDASLSSSQINQSDANSMNITQENSGTEIPDIEIATTTVEEQANSTNTSSIVEKDSVNGQVSTLTTNHVTSTKEEVSPKITKDIEKEENGINITNDEKDELNDDSSKHIEKVPLETINDDDVFEDDTLPYIYDNSLIPAGKMSIPVVYDVIDEKEIDSREFLSQHENELILWRRNIEEKYKIGHPRFICPECKQPVKLSGHKLHKGKVCYFAHFKDSDYCPYKTGTNRTKKEIEIQKYSLIQESERHKRLKSAIASALEAENSQSKGVKNVACEKRINSDIPYLNWRRPDIYAEYNGQRYVFELQLSTTFVSVIVDRDIFYRLNDYNIIWVFNFEDNEEYVNLYNLMCKDIYYANKRNVFIFDADAETKSKEKGELVLKFRWLDENGVWSHDDYVTLDMFHYDEENHKPFIIDADKAYLEKYPEYAERRKQLEHSREFLLKALMERQKQEDDNKNRKIEERVNLQMKLLNDDKCVVRFRSGTKYGYHYEGTTILPAQYTSAQDIREDGYAQVGFNRKIGLVRKDGKEIVPVNYRSIDVINHRHGIVMASYKRLDLWLGDQHFPLCDEFDETEQRVVKEEENGKMNYILHSRKYRYYYTSSYYGDHPIRHKESDGISKTTLFRIYEENDFCIIWITGKTYFLSKNRLSIIDGCYSDIKTLGMEQLFIAKDKDTCLWGVIDFHGNIITDFRYANLIPTDSEYLIAKFTNESSTYGVIDYQGREYIEPQYEALINLNSESFAFRKDILWGICDRMGKILHEATYTYVRGTSTGSLRASTLESYLKKWKVEENIPLYSDDEVKLCVLNEQGEIIYTEQTIGEYHVRHSGDLYSIVSSNNKELINYSLTYVKFITGTAAIIKDVEDNSGFFIDGSCVFFDECKKIEHLNEDLFKFTNTNGRTALGNYSGPVCNYLYTDIKALDLQYFVASQNVGWGYSSSDQYVIIDKTGNILSVEFSSIGEFEDGFANATYQGRKGVIDMAGNMQEKLVEVYGDYKLCEKFENYYFRNKENEIVSDEYQQVTLLINMLFVVKKRDEGGAVRLYSLETNKASDNFFISVTHHHEDLFIAKVGEPAYVIIDDKGNYASAVFSSIGEFEDGFANATYQGRKGVIDMAGNMQENIVKVYGDYTLCEKFENYYFRNKENEIVSDEYQKIDFIIDMFFIVKKRNEIKVRLYSLEAEKETKGDFISVTHFVGNLFIVNVQNQSNIYLSGRTQNPEYQLYNGIKCCSAESFSTINLLENGYIAVQCLGGKKYRSYQIWKIFRKDGRLLNNKKYESIIEANKDSFKVKLNGHIGFIDLDGNSIVEKTLCENGFVLTHCFADNGVEDSDGHTILSLDEHFSSIEFIEGELFKVCRNDKYALYTYAGVPITEHKFESLTYETINRYAVIEDGIKGHIDSLGNYIETSAFPIPGSDLIIFVIMKKYGLRDSTGNIIMPSEYSSIRYLVGRLIVVKKDSKFALFSIEGAPLTEFKYSKIACREDGFINATRDKTIGGLDENGNEVADITHFNGGYLKTQFEDYTVINDAGDVIYPTGYSKIQLLDNNGIFALWEGNKVAIGNLSKEKTEPLYESVESIGNGFYVVSRTISKKVRVRNIGYGYRGNPYTYYTSEVSRKRRFGIINSSFQTIIPCKHASISNFDDQQNIIITKANNEKKTVSLYDLENKASHILDLTLGTEYNVKVHAFMAIGIIVKINENSFVIHKKHLFKEEKDFNKGESFIAKYMGNDSDGHPIWETMKTPDNT